MAWVWIRAATERGPVHAFRTLARKGREQSGYKGARRVKNKWEASISRCGVKTYLGTYAHEGTAATVYQAADGEYKKLVLSGTGGRREEDTCTNQQPASNPPVQVPGGKGGCTA